MATTIKIGHASISENSSVNGAAGDQNAREVYIQENYNIAGLAPNVVLRPKTQTLAEASAVACETGCNNEHIGYSQSGRNTLYTLARELNYNLNAVDTDCNTDCSAFMTVCAIAGGAKITYGTNAPTTSNMRTRFKQSGDYTVLTDTEHLTQTDYLKRGDILVKEGTHTVMVLENGANIDATADAEDNTTVTADEPTQEVVLRNYKLVVEASSIGTTTATFKIKTKKVSSGGTEKLLTNTSKWKYQLVLKTLPELTSTTHQITNNEITLNNLTADSSYIVQVNALKSNGTIVFSSVCSVLTTLPVTPITDEQQIEFTSMNLAENTTLIDKVYIKNQNTFTQAIIYKNN
jgi:hypothetical protein